MDKKETLEFVKNHKKEVAIGCAALIGGTILFAITKKQSSYEKVVTTVAKTSRNLEIPEIEVGEVSDLWKEGRWINMIINGVKVADCGKLGEELVKIPDVTPDTEISAVMSFLNE